MEENKSILTKIKLVANTLFPNCKVLLFGSRARQDFNSHSDYDLLFIISQNIEVREKMQYKSQIRKILVNDNIDFLLKECSKIDKEFEQIDPKNLSDFGISVRYPDDFFLPTINEALEYKDLAFSIKELVESKIILE